MAPRLLHLNIGSRRPTTRRTAIKVLQNAERIFIAYSHRDLAAARRFRSRVVRLRADLPEDTVFLDQESLEPATEVDRDQIDETLCGSDLFVVLCGRDTASRELVCREVEVANEMRKSGRMTILPIILTPGVVLPPGLDFEVQGFYASVLFPSLLLNSWFAWGAAALILLIALLSIWSVREGARREAVRQRLFNDAVVAVERSRLPTEIEEALGLAIGAVEASRELGDPQPPAAVTRALFIVLTEMRQNLPLRGHTGAVLDARFSPDGRRVVTASADRTARVWDARDRRTLAVLDDAQAPIVTAGFSSDGKNLSTLDENGIGRVYDSRSFGLLRTLANGDGRVARVYSPGFDRALLETQGGDAELVESSSGKLLSRLENSAGPLSSAAISHRNEYVFLGFKGGASGIWDASSGTRKHSLTPAVDPAPEDWYPDRNDLWFASFSSDDSRIAAIAWPLRRVQDGPSLIGGTRVMVFDVTSGELKAEHGTTLMADDHGRTALRTRFATFDPSATTLMTAHGSIRGPGHGCLWVDEKWNSPEKAPKICQRLPGVAPFTQISASDLGDIFVTTSEDGTASVWTFYKGGPFPKILAGHEDGVRTLDVSADGMRIVTGSDDQTARVFSIYDGSWVRSWDLSDAVLDSLRFTVDETRLIGTTSQSEQLTWPIGGRDDAPDSHTETVTSDTAVDPHRSRSGGFVRSDEDETGVTVYSSAGSSLFTVRALNSWYEATPRPGHISWRSERLFAVSKSGRWLAIVSGRELQLHDISHDGLLTLGQKLLAGT